MVNEADELLDLFGDDEKIEEEPVIVEPKKIKTVKVKTNKVSPKPRKKTVSQTDFDKLLKRFESLEELVKSKPEVKPDKQVILKPVDLYDNILKKYNIPVSITLKQINELDQDIFDNVDEYVFLKRYKRSRKDIEVYYSLISS